VIGVSLDRGDALMNVAVRGVLVAGLLCALASGGCAGAASVPAGGASGMGMGGTSGPGLTGMGVIAAARDTAMSAATYDAASGTIRVARVLAPADGWVVVQSVSTEGVLGSAAVRQGENADVLVRPAVVDGMQVRVALFVDRGVRGTLEADPDRVAASPDKAVSVDGAPVGSTLTLEGWGVVANPGSVLIMAEDQPAGPTLEVGYLIIPAPSWIEIRRIEKGVPAERIGLVLRPAGEFHRLTVPIEGAGPNDELLVTVLADRGALGSFEPGAGNALLAADQPWISAGVAASQRVLLR
jgi:hypothetical protein